MKKCFLFLAVIFIVTLQLIWPGFLTFFNCKPDLLLVFAVSLVFYFDFKTALIFAILTGFAKDIFLPSSFAINTVSFSIWVYLVYKLLRQISSENDYVRLAIVLLVIFLNNIVTNLQILSLGNIVPMGIFLRNLIISSIYSAAVSPLIYKLIKKIGAGV
ncbi:MAG: rod shape-determining protein MreD [Candidatus Omnitrophota bacterium]